MVAKVFRLHDYHTDSWAPFRWVNVATPLDADLDSPFLILDAHRATSVHAYVVANYDEDGGDVQVVVDRQLLLDTHTCRSELVKTLAACHSRISNCCHCWPCLDN